MKEVIDIHSRNLEARTEAEAVEDAAFWLAPHGSLSMFFYTTQDHLPGVILPTVCWVRPHQLLIKKNAS